MRYSLRALGPASILIGVLAIAASAPRAAATVDAVPEGRAVMVDLGSHSLCDHVLGRAPWAACMW